MQRKSIATTPRLKAIMVSITMTSPSVAVKNWDAMAYGGIGAIYDEIAGKHALFLLDHVQQAQNAVQRDVQAHGVGCKVLAELVHGPVEKVGG